MVPLNSSTLSKVSGGVLAEDIDAALATCHEHCMSQPDVKGDRKVTLTITISPDRDEEPGQITRGNVLTKVTPSLPPRRRTIATHSMRQEGLFGVSTADESTLADAGGLSERDDDDEPPVSQAG